MNKLSRWIRLNLFYLGKPPWDTGVSPPELISFLESVPSGRALDVGCGTGTNLVTMASYGWRVVGVDLAWLSALKAQKKLRQTGVDGQVRHGDVTGRLHLEGTFDLVLDIGCYHSLKPFEREVYVQKLRRWLNPSGTYLLYAHQQTSLDGSHGISEADPGSFSRYFNLKWREDSDEKRLDGGGFRPATWFRFEQGLGD